MLTTVKQSFDNIEAAVGTLIESLASYNPSAAAAAALVQADDELTRTLETRTPAARPPARRTRPLTRPAPPQSRSTRTRTRARWRCARRARRSTRG